MLTSVRNLTLHDVSSAMELSRASHWNQTAEDWRRILYLFAEGCRCIEDAGRIVATATLLPYSTQLAWIGMVLTRREYRRQGLARRLMEDAISTAERSGIPTLKLDATEEGRPLYESLGFVVERVVERWGMDCGLDRAEKTAADVAANNNSSNHPDLSDDLITLDTEAFGVSRRDLLEQLWKTGRCSITSNGYVLSRPGTSARYMGPCVANSEAVAAQLISAHIESNSDQAQGWYWDLFPVNLASIRCAESLGFTRRRTLWRMRLGKAIENNDAMVYAIAGFELG